MSILLLTKLVNAIESGATSLELASLTAEVRVYLDTVESEKATISGNFNTNEFDSWLRRVLADKNSKEQL